MQHRFGLMVLCVLGCSSAEAPSAAPDTETDVPAATCDATRPTLDTLAVTVDGTRILDALGREVLLRGVNAGGRSKVPPFFPFPFAESERPEQAGAPPFADAAAAYAERVRGWGMNVVRVPFTWEAVEPTRGTYDDVFLGRYQVLIEAFAARDIRVIVDFHQDVFARPFCGDGFPLWAVLEEPEEPSYPCHQWFSGYTEAGGQVQRAYDAFWDNEAGLRDAFADFWRHVAGRLGSVEGVIGFEIINEPGWGTRNPSAFQAEILTPFYTQMAAVIREAAPGIPVFFDASGVDAITATTALERPEGEGLVFAPHFYDPTVILTGQWVTRDSDYGQIIGQWRTQGDAWGVPVLLGEFGMRREGEGAGEYVRRNFDALDQHRMHGTLWEYSTTPDDWNDEGMSIVAPDGTAGPTALAAARPYPAAVSGRLAAFTWDADTGAGTLTIDAVPGVTEIALPAARYPEGATATLTGGEGCSTWHPDAGRLAVRTTGTGQVTIAF